MAADVAGVRPDGRRAVARERTEGGGPAGEPGPLLLLPLPPVPAQLLAGGDAAVAGAARRALPAASGVHGLSAVPRAALALRPARAEELLSRLPFLARRILRRKHGDAKA